MTVIVLRTKADRNVAGVTWYHATSINRCELARTVARLSDKRHSSIDLAMRAPAPRMLSPLTAVHGLVSGVTMRTELLMGERCVFDERSFAAFVIGRGPDGEITYLLAFMVDGACVLRYASQAGKVGHRRTGKLEERYEFSTIDRLLADFRQDISDWRREYEDRDA
jgi:hypothetical protein